MWCREAEIWLNIVIVNLNISTVYTVHVFHAIAIR